MEAMKREELLKRHPYKIWQGKDGKWYTYLPDKEKGRVLKKKSTKNKMEDLIILYYKQEGKKEDEKMYMFRERYSIWVKRQKDCGVVDNTVTKYESDYKRFFEESCIENRNEVELATLTGMSSGELSRLMWKNIDFKKKYIVVCQSEKYNRKSREYYIDITKNRKERTIPMTEEMEILLKKIKRVMAIYHNMFFLIRMEEYMQGQFQTVQEIKAFKYGLQE